jgi:hypothetical protein
MAEPTRAEKFERLVERIIQLLEDDGATVTWDDHVVDPDNTTRLRQVDITIRRNGFVTLVECRLHNVAQDVTWIEELIGRRLSLRADSIIAVSASGFTEGAKKKAEAHGIILRDISSLTEEEVRAWGKTALVATTSFEFEDLTLTLYVDDEATPFTDADVTDKVGGALNWRSLVEQFMERMDGQFKAGQSGRITGALETGSVLFRGRTATKVEFGARVRKHVQKYSAAAVFAYANPATPDSTPEAFIQNFLLGDTEVIRSGRSISAVIDLSGLVLPANTVFYTVMLDAGERVKLRGNHLRFVGLRHAIARPLQIKYVVMFPVRKADVV